MRSALATYSPLHARVYRGADARPPLMPSVGLSRWRGSPSAERPPGERSDGACVWRSHRQATPRPACSGSKRAAAALSYHSPAARDVH